MSAATAPAAPHASTPAEHSGNRIARLVRRAALDDRDAWSQLVQEFEGLLRAITRAHRLSEADSADVAQIAWLRLVENFAPSSRKNSLTTIPPSGTRSIPAAANSAGNMIAK